MYSYNIKIIALNIQLNQEVISMESSCDESYTVCGVKSSSLK